MKTSRAARVAGIAASAAGVAIILFGGVKTPENFRVISDLLQNLLLLNAVILLFLPDDRQMKVAALTGCFTAAWDLVLEEAAVWLGWWYPLGGTQFPPVVVVPVEMVASFVIIGTSMALVFYAPGRIRAMDCKLLNWVKPMFKNPRHDRLWLVLLLVVNAIVGTNGDYSAGTSIWVPGAAWHPFYTFVVWFAGGLLVLLVFEWLDRRVAR
ncbi:MAG: hypothetical protein JW839_14925 [Candidatus Lokiarchaeota archaeon]|nr:hypothetical protein [Candidatus Lokiarchaeota archaeon]